MDDQAGIKPVFFGVKEANRRSKSYACTMVPIRCEADRLSTIAIGRIDNSTSLLVCELVP
jgi:hypothetical protein